MSDTKNIVNNVSSDEIISKKNNPEKFMEICKYIDNIEPNKLENEKEKLYDSLTNFTYDKNKKIKNKKINKESLIDVKTGIPTNETNSIKNEEDVKNTIEEEKLIKMENEKMENEKIANEKLEAVNYIIDKLKESNKFFELEESHATWAEILILRENNSSSNSKNNALQFLFKAVKILNKRGAFELNESASLLTCFNKFM